MTPIELETLLRCYYVPDFIPTTKATDSAIRLLVSNGLVILYDESYVPTERGELHVKQLCSLPYPSKKSVWVDGNGEVIREAYK